MRDRGADGVNLDFEPIVSTYADEFTALVRSVRAELNKVSQRLPADVRRDRLDRQLPDRGRDRIGRRGRGRDHGLRLQERLVEPGRIGRAARRTGLRHRRHDPRPTSRACRPRRSSSACRTTAAPGRPATSAFASKNISSTKNGASTTVVYGTARQYAADHGRKWDPVQGVAWTVYRRENCTATYGCVKPWRQIYYDDAKALGLKYDADQPLQPAWCRDLGARL